jgi:NADH-quinone oxidoreductase subunit I
MYGIGILKGLGVTIKHFVDTYVNDLAWLGTKRTQETFEIRQGTQSAGINTVEYPDEKLAVPERFRFVPFLVVNNYDDPHAAGHDWCTSCGICAKVCPPQCIWIVRGTHADTGRPKPEPEAFYIDIDICMNCGYCSEFCPFDAIKMDHDYELAEYDRTTEHIFDKQKLSKEVRYWQSIAPTTNLEEAILRGQWEHKDTLKVAKKANIPMTDPVWEKRDAAFHNPDLVAAKQAAAAPRPVAGAPPPVVAAPVSVSLDVDGADPDQLAGWSGDESLPLAARAAAAVKLESMIQEKTFKPSSTHRKAVSAAKKTAKEENTTIEDAAKGFKSGQVVTTAPAATPAPVTAAPSAAAPTAAAAPAAVSIDVEGATPDQLAEWASNEGLPLAAQSAAAVKLDGMIRAKEFKPTSAHRKAISAAKKVAKDADTTIEDAAATFTAGEVVAAVPVAATAPAAPQAAAPPPTEAPVPAPSGGSVDVANAGPDQLAEWASNEGLSLQDRASAAVKLDGMIRAKEFKPTSNHRKAISLAKKAAVDANTTIEDAAQ